MSLCWSVFSKVPWSCWYCACYLNDSFEFLRTSCLRKRAFWLFIFILKFVVWGAKKKDVEQQRVFEWSHTIAAVFCFMAQSQTCASGTLSPDMHRVNPDSLWHSCKVHFRKSTNPSAIRKQNTTDRHCCSYDVCFYCVATYSTNKRTST